jgi:hypothetical protein
MKINRFILPDEDPFLYPVRPIVENSFKLITWFGVAATLQIAASATGSWYLWGICGFAYLLILLYLQAFLDWFWKIRSDRSLNIKASVSTASGMVSFFRKILRRVLGTVIWLTLMVTTQHVVTRAIAAIIAFQTKTSH